MNLIEENEKPKLLKAVELVLADPADIKREVLALQKKYDREYGGKRPDSEITNKVANKIISNYSYFTAFVGGASGLTGVVPGLGTVLAAFGGATADAALSMKYQIEMTMALAVVYGHDIEVEEEKRLCLLIAGLGAINKAAKESGKTLGSKALVKVIQEHLKGATLVAVKEVFKKLGIIFTRKAVEKAIPFGVSVIIGFAANKSLTKYVGKGAKRFFSVNAETV